VLVAEVAAKPTPAPVANDNSFYAFCRANWPAFVVFQTCALTGAIVSGVSSRKKRIELELIMKKYRRMMDRVDDMTCTFDWDLGMEQCTDDWPGSTELAVAKMLLDDNGDADAALAEFAKAKTAVRAATDDLKTLKGDVKATSSWVSAGKGAALALVSKGTGDGLRAAVDELKSVAEAAELDGDSTVYGMLGDVLTDLGDYAAAGAYYDKVLSMD
jgi:tetratricopeptide (TPR) repeat protein